jgi:hypothetical protein
LDRLIHCYKHTGMRWFRCMTVSWAFPGQLTWHCTSALVRKDPCPAGLIPLPSVNPRTSPSHNVQNESRNQKKLLLWFWKWPYHDYMKDIFN